MEAGVTGTTFLETGKGIEELFAIHTEYAEAQSIYFEVRTHSTLTRTHMHSTHNFNIFLSLFLSFAFQFLFFYLPALFVNCTIFPEIIDGNCFRWTWYHVASATFWETVHENTNSMSDNYIQVSNLQFIVHLHTINCTPLSQLIVATIEGLYTVIGICETCTSTTIYKKRRTLSGINRRGSEENSL